MLVALALMLSILPAQSGSDRPRSPAPDISFVASRLVAPPDAIAYYDRVREGIRLFNTGKFDEAAAKLKAAADEYPLDGSVWIYLGDALRRAGKPKEAIAPYEKGLELTSTWQPLFVRYVLSQSYLAAGDKEAAYRTLETALQQDQFVRMPDLYNDASFAALKSEPRFQKLVG